MAGNEEPNMEELLDNDKVEKIKITLQIKLFKALRFVDYKGC